MSKSFVHRIHMLAKDGVVEALSLRLATELGNAARIAVNGAIPQNAVKVNSNVRDNVHENLVTKLAKAVAKMAKYSVVGIAETHPGLYAVRVSNVRTNAAKAVAHTGETVSAETGAVATRSNATRKVSAKRVLHSVAVSANVQFARKRKPRNVYMGHAHINAGAPIAKAVDAVMDSKGNAAYHESGQYGRVHNDASKYATAARTKSVGGTVIETAADVLRRENTKLLTS